MAAELPASAELDDLSSRADADPNVAGVMLTGSCAREGMPTSRSDIDVYVFLWTPDRAWQSMHTPAIDAPVCLLDDLRVVPGPDDPDGWWERYAYAHTKILLDRTDGELERLINGWGTLSGAESKLVLEAQLDGYINYVYRSLKSLRDDRQLEARLDAVESLVWGLSVLFAFERRVRPYNKYLPWELRTHPLERPAWQADRLLPILDRIVNEANPVDQRALFTSIVDAAEEVGLGGILEAWGDEIATLRGKP